MTLLWCGAGKIWPWLVQLGQGRGGLYSNDWLKNLIGCDVHSADRIVPAFQTPFQLGDRVIRMARYAPYAQVAVFQPQRALVLGHIGDTCPARLPDTPAAPGRSSSSRSARPRPGISSAAAATH